MVLGGDFEDVGLVSYKDSFIVHYVLYKAYAWIFSVHN